MGDIAVRGFVKGDGDDHRDRPDRYEIDCVTAHGFDPRPRLKILEFLGSSPNIEIARGRGPARSIVTLRGQRQGSDFDPRPARGRFYVKLSAEHAPIFMVTQ